MTEEWRAVPGHPRYLVSSEGHVAKVLREVRSTNGYVRTSLSIGRGKHAPGLRFGVHQVVAWAFLGPVPDGHEVHHIDGTRTNNRAENLRYVTRSENILASPRRGRPRRGAAA